MKFANAINEFVEAQSSSQPFYYLDASIIGSLCDRKLWYAFNNVMDVPRDAFDINIEASNQMHVSYVERLMMDLGVTVFNKDPKSRKRWYLECSQNGYLTATMHGVLVCESDDLGVPKDTPFVYKIIPLGNDNFNSLKNDGLEKYHYTQFVELNTQMALTESVGNAVLHGLVIGFNTDTGELSSEVISYNSRQYEATLHRAELIVRNEEIPPRCNESNREFLCEDCMFKEVCSGETIPRPSCRNCGYCTRNPDGIDVCEKGFNQTKACNFHIFNPDLLIALSGKPVAFNNKHECMEYESFFNGNKKAKKSLGKPVYTSDELHLIFSDAMLEPDASEFINEIIRRYNGTVKSTEFIDELPEDDIPFD